MLKVIKSFDPWKSKLCTCPPKYSLNPYTGCSHKCVYCYATSYIGFRDSIPKKNVINNVAHDLKLINKNLPINLSTSSDPYPPIESKLRITRKVLELLIRHNCKILITTKSHLVLNDVELLRNGKVAIMITITTLDDNIRKIIEPYASSIQDRLQVIKKCSDLGIPIGVRIDPIIPYVNDDEYMLRNLVQKVYELGAKHIVTSTYKAKPDNFKRLLNALENLPDAYKKIESLYKDYTTIIQGYKYLRKELREKLLKPIIDEARKIGLTYATCREGFTGSEWINSTSCDGSHLIEMKLSINFK